jgi:hypothetical protein
MSVSMQHVHVYAECPYPFPFYMSMSRLHIHVHFVCPCLCSCCMSTPVLHVHAHHICPLSMLHVHVVHVHADCQCSYCMFKSMSMFHDHVHAARPCPCCMFMSVLHSHCPCCMSMFRFVSFCFREMTICLTRNFAKWAIYFARNEIHFASISRNKISLETLLCSKRRTFTSPSIKIESHMEGKHLPKHSNPFSKGSPCKEKFNACPIAYEKQSEVIRFQMKVMEPAE